MSVIISFEIKQLELVELMALTSGEAPLTKESQGRCRLRLVGNGKEMVITQKTISKFKRAPELTFQDYLGALPEGNKIINVGRGIGYGYEHNYDESIKSILDSYHHDSNFDSALTNCVGHDDRTPSLLMSWIPSWKFKSDYMFLQYPALYSGFHTKCHVCCKGHPYLSS